MPLPLTPMFGEFDRQMAKTYPGQAHTAGSGPPGKTCRECIEYQASKRLASGELAKGRCYQRARLMSIDIKKSPTFPYTAGACRHFAQNPQPPKAFERKW